jgi:hypothetical protein
LRIFSREANFSFVFGLSTGTNWIKTKENSQVENRLKKEKQTTASDWKKATNCDLCYGSKVTAHLLQ